MPKIVAAIAAVRPTRQSSDDEITPRLIKKIRMLSAEPRIASSSTFFVGLLATIRWMVSRGRNQTETQGEGWLAVTAFMRPPLIGEKLAAMAVARCRQPSRA